MDNRFWGEGEPAFDYGQARAEAARCLLCHDAPCSKGCPAGTDPATFVRKLRMQDVRGAIRTVRENNVLGGACGILCPTAKLCEAACCASGIDRPIRIGRIQRFLVEHGRAIGYRPPRTPPPTSGRVAVVGAGPAGIACAAALARDGFRVTVFEARSEAGGVLRYGVPTWRFPPEMLAAELDDVRALGVEFRCDAPVEGRGAVEALLAEGYRAVFVATGCWAPVRDHAGDGPGVTSATAFLARLRTEGEAALGRELAGKRVAVLGGGSVATDCAGSAVRLGARDVYLVYRRSYTEMPAEEEERQAALRGGVHFLLLARAEGYVVDDDGRLRGLRLRRTVLGDPDASGRRAPVDVPGELGTLEVDLVIEAFGSRVPDGAPELYPSVHVARDGRILADAETGATSVPGVFAGGDVVRGPALVVKAIADGKAAARAIRTHVDAQEGRVTPAAPERATRAADLSVEMCGVRFVNPFLLSSSPVSNSAEMVARAFEAGWGGVAYKTIVTDRIPIIHPSPRMKDYVSADGRLLGVQNVEQTSDRGLAPNLRDIAWLKRHWPDRVVMASIMGFSAEEWAVLAKACTDAGADLLELNFSCPHMAVEGSGAKVGQVHDLVERFTATVRAVTHLPLVAKLTPNIADMTEPALAAKRGGADGLSAINTVRGLVGVDPDTAVPTLGVFGKGASSGYSGPGVKPIGLRFIAELAACRELGLPLSGIGGIETWLDALEYLLVGATTLQVTTGIIRFGYRMVADLVDGLAEHMQAKGVARVADLVGSALPNIHEVDAFDVARQGVATYDLDRCVGCGRCYVACADAGGKALAWDTERRRPVHDVDTCLSCMVCSFVCPVEGLVGFREMPRDWKRKETVTLG